MTEMRRTTISAPAEDLATLEAEARRRDLPLTALVQEAIEAMAMELRRSRRPRLGVGRSTDGRSARDTASDPVAHEPRG